jgi:hypothetical protein
MTRFVWEARGSNVSVGAMPSNTSLERTREG